LSRSHPTISSVVIDWEEVCSCRRSDMSLLARGGSQELPDKDSNLEPSG
jgi:hypothetical protein